MDKSMKMTLITVLAIGGAIGVNKIQSLFHLNNFVTWIIAAVYIVLTIMLFPQLFKNEDKS